MAMTMRSLDLARARARGHSSNSSANRAALASPSSRRRRRARPVVAAAPSSSSSSPASEASPTDPPPSRIAGLSVRVARTAAELRAAAYLRAAAFGAYPPDRSPFAARAHRRMRGDAEWEAVTAKVRGAEPAYSSLRVACLIAAAPVRSPRAGESAGGGAAAAAAETAALAAALAAERELEPSAALLPSAAGDGDPDTVEAVVGTLDVNVGAVLPAEELVGRRGRVGRSQGGGGGGGAGGEAPAASPPPFSTRGYLSNVCVAKAARGQGVGKALLRAAEALVALPEAEGGLLRAPPASERDDGCGGEGASADADADAAGDDGDDKEEAASFHLYVHVVHDNAAARALYEGRPSPAPGGGGDRGGAGGGGSGGDRAAGVGGVGGGFRVESEETEAFARGLARPRRLLLHKRLPPTAAAAVRTDASANASADASADAEADRL